MTRAINEKRGPEKASTFPNPKRGVLHVKCSDNVHPSYIFRAVKKASNVTKCTDNEHYSSSVCCSSSVFCSVEQRKLFYSSEPAADAKRVLCNAQYTHTTHTTTTPHWGGTPHVQDLLP